jgi:hypothetical protein
MIQAVVVSEEKAGLRTNNPDYETFLECLCVPKKPAWGIYEFDVRTLILNTSAC